MTSINSSADSVTDGDVDHLSPLSKSAFSFDLVKRNSMLAATGLKMPLMMKTGTTIAGVIFKDGVVLGADTRATEGSIIADKNCAKIHHISSHIWCCGAGTAADTENITNLISSQLELHRLATGKKPRVITALTRLKQRLFQYQGHISAALVLGGVDATGSHLYTVYPHGSTDCLAYATMGSGSLAAMAVFESGYRDNLTQDDAMLLVAQAIQSGIFNDLGSGSNVDLCIIRKDSEKVAYYHNYLQCNPRLYKRPTSYQFQRGTTEVIKETIKLIKQQNKNKNNKGKEIGEKDKDVGEPQGGTSQQIAMETS